MTMWEDQSDSDIDWEAVDIDIKEWSLNNLPVDLPDKKAEKPQVKEHVNIPKKKENKTK